MAFDRQWIRLTANGYLGAVNVPTEIWSWGLKLSGDLGFDAVTKLAALDMVAISSAVTDFHEGANANISDKAFIVSVKCAAIGVDGGYLTDPREYEHNSTSGSSGSGTVRYPNQIAQVISLRTVTNIGLATRGRFFIPLPCPILNQDGLASGASTDNVRTAAVTMLDELNNEFNQAPEPAVLSLMSDRGTTGIRTRGVTQVRVGNVLDTMRSRRNALTETYSLGTVTS